ncbi:hypothetical protein DK847_04835 [Aestuariivirga litoralis]|uniref:DUF1214 domain-containing protein n=1 Tax=Aestuariivirga litoralis TaxID=2650924 RepID=A0A2W2BNC5_9HYPH|nr:DUF1214 domain-containing protein [Aestuariivirga litoralis]PZF77759.1 hypothetical protein DK847_04835 [Aestuariivirga litoralis]
MRRFIWATAYVAFGVAAGCFSAFALIQSAGVEPVTGDEPWQSRTAAMAGPNAFYVRSHYLLEGRLPPAPSQLGEATTETDSKGRPLTGGCSYLITSTGPLPRWWSLGIVGSGSAGAPLQTTADSDTAVREADGSVRISAARDPQPGNWLKSPDRRSFTLIYSALATGTRTIDPPFAITRGICS